ncbi:MAG TPA: MerR family transcriptional regulator [bacterium]|nr:MerR family transcriptional regulator [bacterium]
MIMIKDDVFYTIGETVEILDVPAHTLRYWEKEFKDFVKPRRNGQKNRIYSTEDINVLKLVKRLLEVELYTVAGARRQLYIRSSDAEELTG